MAQCLAHHIELGAFAHVVRREGVAQRVGRGVGDTRFSQVLRDDGVDRTGPERLLEWR